MRPHGRQSISARRPEAGAVCDRCGFRYAHNQLSWQFDWMGPRIQNKRILVCPSCIDIPQDQLRDIILPPDPVAILNPRPEDYTGADNPIGGLGYDPLVITLGPQAGATIGTLGNGNAAFDGNSNKPGFQSAYVPISANGLNNWVGKNWSAVPGTAVFPSSLRVATQSYVINGAKIVAPSDMSFLRSGVTILHLDGSNDGATWTTVWSGQSAGTVGESITVTQSQFTSLAYYAYHRLNIRGDGTAAVGVAQIVLNAMGPSGAETSGDIG